MSRKANTRTLATDGLPLLVSLVSVHVAGAAAGLQMLSAGFTIVRDMGNNGLYADPALRQAIDQGWLPGTKIQS